MLLSFTQKGIYCPQADLYIDPWRPIKNAILTHAHSDHARPGCDNYLAHHDSENILRHRLGAIHLQTLAYNEKLQVNGVTISLHPAGHIQGSSQIRLEYKGEIWVVSGDYKLQTDGITPAFEPVPCQHFITESTFGLPVFNFPQQGELKVQINDWVRQTNQQGMTAVLIAYSLGKAQRVLSALETEAPILLHTSVYQANEALGFKNNRYQKFEPDFKKESFHPGVIVAPPSALGSAWMRRFEPCQTAVCSGWMQLRGARRRMNVDKGFIMSDHADWKGLNEAVLATGAPNIYVTHGYRSVFARWLREKYQLNAVELETQFADEGAEEENPERA